MLDLIFESKELFDDKTQTFLDKKTYRLQLEHSLVSLSKWESKWEIPFLSSKKTDEQTFDYIKCMTITQNVKPEVYDNLPLSSIQQIQSYISAPMTATWFRDEGAGRSKEIITAELIYYWMIAYKIPVEFQKWHLNRLMTLIRVCAIKNDKPKKPGKQEMLNNRRALNDARRAQLNTKG